MIHFLRGIFEARPDVIGFQVGEVGENFAFRHIGRQQIQHVFDADAQPPDAGTSAALVGVEGEMRSANFMSDI